MQCHKCVLPKHPAPFFHTSIVLWILMHDIIMHCGEHFMSCYRNKLFCISFIYFRRYYWPFGSWSALVKIKANNQRFPNIVVWFWAKFPCNGFPPIFSKSHSTTSCVVAHLPNRWEPSLFQTIHSLPTCNCGIQPDLFTDQHSLYFNREHGTAAAANCRKMGVCCSAASY